MKKWLIKLIIGVGVLILVVVGIRFVVRRVFTGEGISKITKVATEKVTEGVAEKTKEIAEKVRVEEAEKKAESPAKKVSSGKMNDEKWVEITAYGLLQLTEEYPKVIEYEKFGVTEDEFSAYTEKIAEDTDERSYILIEKARKRAGELQKAGE